MHCVTFHNVEKETKKTYKGLNARCRNHPISLSWDALRVKRLAKSRPCGLQKRPGMKLTAGTLHDTHPPFRRGRVEDAVRMSASVVRRTPGQVKADGTLRPEATHFHSTVTPLRANLLLSFTSKPDRVAESRNARVVSMRDAELRNMAITFRQDDLFL